MAFSLTASRIVLQITSRGLTAYRVTRSGCVELERITVPPQGRDQEWRIAKAALATLVGRHPKHEFVVLVDAIEEEIHAETFARLPGKDGQMLMNRKLDQRLRDTPYRRAIPLVDATKRKFFQRGDERDQRWILAGLSQTESLRAWMEVLIEQKARVQSLVSPLLLAPTVLKQQSWDGRYTIVVTATPAGLRLVALRHGGPLFARLSQNLRPQDITAQTALSEVTRTQSYLQQARLAEQGTLQVVILASPSWTSLDAAALPSNDRVAFHVYDDPYTTDPESGASLVWVEAAAHWRGTEDFSSQTLRLQATVAHWRLRLSVATAAASLTCLALAGAWALQAQASFKHRKDLEIEARGKRSAAEALIATFPTLPDTRTNVKGAVKFFDTLQPSMRLSYQPLARASQAVDRSPDIVLESVEWGAPRGEQTAPAVEAPALEPGVTPPLEREVQLVGRVSEADRMARVAVNERVSRFAQALRDSGAKRVQLDQLPFGASAQWAATTGEGDRARVPPFRLTAVYQEGS